MMSAMRWIAIAATLVASSAALAQPSSRQREGAAALMAGRLAEAQAHYEAALAEPSPDAPVWFDLCLVRYAVGDYGRAINACFRALPADETRVIMLLQRISDAMSAAKLVPARVVVPEPLQPWFRTETWISQRLSASAPPAAASATRSVFAPPARGAGSYDVLPEDQLDGLRGAAPPLPYRISPRAADYTFGYDVSFRTGVLFYAPDTTPLVAGTRVEGRTHVPSSVSHASYFGEYLHALDGTGGVASVGAGARGGGYSGSYGFSVPWGRSEGRNALIRNHTFGLHGELRLGAYREIAIGRSWAIAFEGSVLGGIDLPNLAIEFGHAIKNGCIKEDDDDSCPEPTAANPDWPLFHWGVQLGISFGRREGHPPYRHAEVFAPMGGS
jgi:hypothetical protein